MKGFVLEDEVEYSQRKKAKVVKRNRLSVKNLDRESFLKMIFFQYMIANTDWSVGNLHNLEIVKLQDVPKIIAIPYDFDYSGFVGQDYAVPYHALPIFSVKERYFHSAYKINEDEFYLMLDYYLGLEQKIYAFCDQAYYFKNSTIKKNKKFLKSFFSELRNPKRLKKSMVK